MLLEAEINKPQWICLWCNIQFDNMGSVIFFECILPSSSRAPFILSKLSFFFSKDILTPANLNMSCLSLSLSSLFSSTTQLASPHPATKTSQNIASSHPSLLFFNLIFVNIDIKIKKNNLSWRLEQKLKSMGTTDWMILKNHGASKYFANVWT